jgi:GTP cyclohydrolase I
VAGDGPVVGLDEVDLDAAFEVFLEVRRDPRIQLEQAAQAAEAFLEALGVDLTRSGMDDTPARMARADAELFSPRPFRATHFPNEGYDQMVLAKEVADWLNEHLTPRGVGVVLQAEHTCTTLRGSRRTTPGRSHPHSSARCGTTRPHGPSSSP